MKTVTIALTAAFAAGLVLAPEVQAGCGKHGTQVEFVDTPKEAAAKAKKEEKLVFVLHLSGVFEDPNLT
jgi:hypothetical protein